MNDRPASPAAADAVLTVTLNPSLDLSMSVEQFVPDHKLRAFDDRREAGGGGVNVSRVLRRLDVPTRSFVVVGGAVGSELASLMRDEELDVFEFTISGTTRESVAITEASSGRQYRLSVTGPIVEDADRLRRLIREAAAAVPIVVLSGSLPQGVPDDFLGQLVDDLGPATTTIIDTSGAALDSAAKSAATIIKPSQRELARLVGWEPSTADEVERAAQQILGHGEIHAVVASRGPSGALLATREGVSLWFRPPPVRPVSTVGAGDSMVAGIAAGIARGEDLVDAVRLGVAAGTATVLSAGTQLCDPADVSTFVEQVTISTPA